MERDEGRVRATLNSDRGIMAPLLDDHAILDHRDHISALYRGQPVRDDHCCSVHHHPVQGVLHCPLGFCVERACRFVE